MSRKIEELWKRRMKQMKEGGELGRWHKKEVGEVEKDKEKEEHQFQNEEAEGWE